jgi:hypothetical protein
VLILFLKEVKQEINDLQVSLTYYTTCFPSSDPLLFDHFGDLYIDRMHTYNGNPQAFIQKRTKISASLIQQTCSEPRVTSLTLSFAGEGKDGGQGWGQHLLSD